MATPTKPATTLLILGAGGELTHRLLLPGIATLLMAERDRTLRIVGSDRVEMTPAEWKSRIKDSFAPVQAPQTVTRAASKDTAYIKADSSTRCSCSALSPPAATGRSSSSSRCLRR